MVGSTRLAVQGGGRAVLGRRTVHCCASKATNEGLLPHCAAVCALCYACTLQSPAEALNEYRGPQRHPEARHLPHSAGQQLKKEMPKASCS